MKINNYKSLKEISLFLLDMDGTIYKGSYILPGVNRFLEEIVIQGKDYLYLTNNSSFNSRICSERLSSLGLPTPKDKILTSGEATALYLLKHNPGSRIFLIGTPDLQEEFVTRGFTMTDIDPEIIVLGFDTGVTYAKLWRLCELVKSGVTYIATNPDNTCFYENGFMPEIEPMIAYVEAATGIRPGLIIGKPNQLMAEIAAMKCGISKDSMAIIGDFLDTDIAMGKNADIPTILVMTGETKSQDIEDSPIKPDFEFDNLDEITNYLQNLG